MASVTIKSQIITDLDATPVVKTLPYEHDGVVRSSVGVVTTNSDDSIGSDYRFCRVPSNARVEKVLVSCDVGGALAGAGDVGLYNINGGAVVDADFFASAYDFNAAGDSSNVDVTYEAAAGASNLVANAGKRLWEALGLTEDPGVEYDVAITLTEAITTGASVLAVKCEYVLDK